MVTLPINFVDAAVNDLTPESMRLPSVVWSGCAFFGKMRYVWRRYRYAKLYSDPKNFAHLLGGHVVNYVVGDRLLVKVAAHSLLIVTRVLECIQAQNKLRRSGDELINAVLDRYVLQVKETWPNNSKSLSFFSPSTVAWWQTTNKVVLARVTRIGLALLKLMKHALELSMLIADTVDAFYVPSEMHSHSVHACFVNAAKWLEVTAAHKEEMLIGLTDHKALIERILQFSSFTFDQLYQSVDKNLERVVFLNDCSSFIADYTGETTYEIGKRALNGIFVVLGAKPVS